MTGRLRGHADARIDDKGRLKMPSVFKKTLTGEFGPALFITALTDDHLQIYPLSVWEEVEARVNALGKMHPLKLKFMTRANRFGTEVEMDDQGRVPLKPNQRQLVGIDLQTEISLIGCADHIELRPATVLAALDGKDALSYEEFQALEM